MIDSAAESSPDESRESVIPRGTIIHVDSPVGGVISHPVTPLYGWLAVDSTGTFEQLSLVNEQGLSIPLEMMPRPDVVQATPGKISVGFTGWLDIRVARVGSWKLEYSCNGATAKVALPLVVDELAAQAFALAKADKLQRLRELIRCPICRGEFADDGDTIVCRTGHRFPVRRDAYDFLETAARASAVVPVEGVSSHGYDASLLELIAQSPGPILDVGAGLRPAYLPDVINLEIVPYPTTDVIGTSEFLPFADDTFDLVISVAVLEHVRDPFAAARELQRVLKPGGRIFAAVPFLQPYHAFPDHYYNMTSGGLRNLFPELILERLDVPQSGGPIFTLTWILQAWRRALSPETAAAFDNMRVADLAVDPMQLVALPFVTELPQATNVQLASLNVLVGRKPQLEES